MTIYLDSEFKCHCKNPHGIFRQVETDMFLGKCDAYIEGFRLVPGGESWTRSDGVTFTGLMIAPWQDFALLDAAQREYEQARIADMQQALNTLGVNVDG